MTETEREVKLERLRKLWSLARAKGNVHWCEQIEGDAKKLKEVVCEDINAPATFEEAKEIFKLPT